MTPSKAVFGLLLAACAAVAPFTVHAQVGTHLAGKWTLNRDLSQIPKEVGFSPDWLAAGSGGDTGAGGGGGGRGGRGGRGGGGARTPASPVHFESADEARLVQEMTAEIRNPPAQLTVTADPTSISISGEGARSRTFHPDGRQESVPVENLTVSVTATGDPGRLTVVYKVEQGRELKYTFSRTADPPRLTVDVQFAGRGGGDLVKYVYEPTRADADAGRIASQAAPPAGVPASSAQRPAGQPAAPPAVNQRPGAELKGLIKLGVVVEELGSQAAACGLKHDVIEGAVVKQLTDAAFTVARNSDEDSYVYVNISTASVSSGVCVSRYDVFIYSHATATLSYQSAPALVQVLLLHRGGLAGGATAAHPNDVLRGVQEYLGQFITRIRDASK
jgi:hypothetical protein